MSTARDWLDDEYQQLERRRAHLDATHGHLTVPAGTSITTGRRTGLMIRRGHVTIVVTADGIADRWGHRRTDPAPTLAELRLTSKATAQQVIDALTVYTDPACEYPHFYCPNTADHSMMVDGDERFLCATHCPDCGEEAA